MKVFKFGGASVKDAEAVKNAGEILNQFKGEELIVVISAMASTIDQSANQKSFRVRIEMVRVGFKALFVTMS